MEIDILKKEELVITEQIKKRLTVDIQRKINKLIVDLYNLIFGKDQETQMFWSEHLVPKCMDHFQIKQAM